MAGNFVVYDLDYTRTGTAREVVEGGAEACVLALLDHCSLKFLHALKLTKIGAAQRRKAEKRLADARAIGLQIAKGAGLAVVAPPVAWTEDLEAEAVAQGRDGPADVVELYAVVPEESEPPTERVAVDADPGQWPESVGPVS